MNQSNWHMNPGQTSDMMNDIETDSSISEFHPTYELPPFHLSNTKVSSKKGPLSIMVGTARDIYVSDGLIHGFLQISCVQKDACQIGKISVSIVGFEQNRKGKVKMFVVKQCMLQELDGPPSDAVFATSGSNGMFMARKASTLLDFSIPLSSTCSQVQTLLNYPLPLPSSFCHPKIGGVRYVIAAMVDSSLGPLSFYKEVRIVESCLFTLDDTFANLTERTAAFSKQVVVDIKSGFFGFRVQGQCTLKASLRTPRIRGSSMEHGIWKSGDCAYVGIHIDNTSTKKVVRCKVQLIRTIKTFTFNKTLVEKDRFEGFRTMVVSETKYSTVERQDGRDILDKRKIKMNSWSDEKDACKVSHSWTGVNATESTKLLTSLQIPYNACSIRNASLIDVSFKVLVSISLTHGYSFCLIGRKAIEMELPITILNPTSLLPELARIDNEMAPLPFVPVTEVVSGEDESNPVTEVVSDGDESKLEVSGQTESTTTLIGEGISAEAIIRTNTRKKQPLKSFDRGNRGNTLRLKKPPVLGMSPAMKSLTVNMPPPPTIPLPSVVERQGARRLELGVVSTTDLDTEIDKV